MIAQKTKLIGLKEFRQDITSLWKKAQSTNTKYIVMFHAQPVLEVNPISPKEELMKKLQKDIAQARQDVVNGRLFTPEQVLKELGIS